jgi:hypothetical protein
MSVKLAAVSKACYFQLRQLRLICKRLDGGTVQTVLQAFVSSRLDYCNVLYSALPAFRLRQLQLIQNSAARVYSRSRRFEHITPVLRDLHWLPIAARIQFKTGLFVYKALHNQLPVYLREFCIWAGQSHEHFLRSVSRHDLAAVRTRTRHYGDRTFQSIAADIWSDLPLNVRTADSVAVFCSQLKTHLFAKTYG